jgi:hypothetical protein
MIQLAIYASYGGALIGDYSTRASGVTFATNDRGYAECQAFLSLSVQESFDLYDRRGLPFVQAFAVGAIFEGRLEDVAIVDGGVHITALGYSRAMSDAPYTALWSKTDVAGFRPIVSTEVSTVVPDRFAFDSNNRIYIAPQKNATLGTTGTTKQGMMCFIPPDQGSRDIIGVSFDFVFVAPAANWRVAFQTRNADFTGIANPWIISSAGAATATGTIHATFAAAKIVNFFMDFNAADAVYAGETGATYLRITNLRLVTSTTNRINTTLGTNIAAGTRTVTPGSMARIYVGQSLQIDQASTTVAESVTVTAITATTFTAVFAFAHVIASTVNAHVVYADEIAKDLVSVTNTLNSTQLSSDTSMIASPSLDLLHEVYEDQYPADILDYLVGIGDSSGYQWECGVKSSQRLYFRRQGSAAHTWYIDVSALDVQRLLDPLANSIYAVYQDASGRNVRAAATSDSASITRYGVTRRQALSVSSTSATQASLQQAAALADGKDPKPRSGITINQVFDANGSRWPLWYVQAGDTVIIRNLAPTLSTSIDRIRVFRLARAEYAFDTDTLSLEPETPLPKLDALLAKIAAGVKH